MKIHPLLLPGALVANLALSGYLLVSRKEASQEIGMINDVASQSDDSSEEVSRLRNLVNDLQGRVEFLSSSADGGDSPNASSSETVHQLAARLESMESNFSNFRNAMADEDIEAAAAERDELFKGEDGDVKATEYFEAGKYALAGEGYLTFLAAHPNHPEHRSIVERARRAFMRAGNLDKAIAVHGEYMELYPENRPADLMTLAHMQKESGNFEAAAQSARDSAGLVNDQSKYWNLLYSAWYTQLGDGLEAGLTAHQDVLQQINAAGFTDTKMHTKVQEKITEIENQIAAEGK